MARYNDFDITAPLDVVLWLSNFVNLWKVNGRRPNCFLFSRCWRCWKMWLILVFLLLLLWHEGCYHITNCKFLDFSPYFRHLSIYCHVYLSRWNDKRIQSNSSVRIFATYISISEISHYDNSVMTWYHLHLSEHAPSFVILNDCQKYL